MATRLAGAADLQAARALFRSAQSAGSLIASSGAAFISSSTASTAAASVVSSLSGGNCLVEARRLYSNFIGTAATSTASSIKFPLPMSASASLLSGDVAPATRSAFLTAGSALWSGIVSMAKVVGGKLALVLRFLIANPRIVCGGAASVSVVAGVVYLIVNRDVVSRAFLSVESPAAATLVDADSAAIPSSSCVGGSKSPPSHLTCPITCEIFTEPVTLPSGHSFEKAAIQTWVAENRSCPMTREPCTLEQVIPNHNLRHAVQDFLEQQQQQPAAAAQ